MAWPSSAEHRRGAVSCRIFFWMVVAALVGCASLTPDSVAPQAPTRVIVEPVIPAPSPSVTPLTFPPAMPSPTGPPLPQQGLKLYPSLNQVSALAFDGSQELWAGTRTGAVHWDLNTSTPTHHLFKPCETLAACGPQTQWVHDIEIVPTASGESIVWAATSSGVQVLEDGVWTAFTQDDGLPDPLCPAITAAPDGSIWVGTGSGLARFDGRAWKAYVLAEEIEGDTIWSVDAAADGVVWASAHSRGVLRYEPAEDTWRRFSTETGFALPNARVLAVAPDGQPWVHIGYDNVYRFDGKDWQVAYETRGGQWVCDMAFGTASDPYGTEQNSALPFIATCDGFHSYGVGVAYSVAGAWRYITGKTDLPSNNTAAVAVGPSGEIAVGTDRGVSVYRNGRWRTLRDGPSLGTITAVAVTPDGVAWFGYGDNAFYAAGGGLATFDGEEWHYPDVGELGKNANVSVLAVAPDGVLWAGAGCSATYLEEGQWTVAATCDQVEGNVRALAFGPDGETWLATDFGIYLITGGTIVPKDSTMPMALAVDAKGTPWVARNPMVGGGLYSFDGTSWISHTVSLEIVTSLAAAPDGKVWASGGGSVATFDGALWHASEHVLQDVKLVAIGPQGDVWAVRVQAISRLAETGWRTVIDLGVPIHAVAFTPEASLWLATTMGAVHYAP